MLVESLHDHRKQGVEDNAFSDEQCTFPVAAVRSKTVEFHDYKCTT
jgi:hypothetical protein